MKLLTHTTIYVACLLCIVTCSVNGQSTLTIHFQNQLKHLKDPSSKLVLFTFKYATDTIHYDEKKYIIKPPLGFDKSHSAFAFIQFEHQPTIGIPSNALLFMDGYDKDTVNVYLDQNLNLNFEDDGLPMKLYHDSGITLSLSEIGATKFKIELNVEQLKIKDDKHRAALESYANPNLPSSEGNIFLPAKFWLTEMRRNYKLSEPEWAPEIALMDWNNNGRFDDLRVDRILIADSAGKTLNDRKQIYRYTLGVDTIIKYANSHYEILAIDPSGENIQMKALNELEHFNDINLLVAGNQLPDFDFINMEGGNKSLNRSLTNGKYLLIDFWGTWCRPCLNQIDDLKLLKTTFSKELEILSLAYLKHDDAKAFVQEHHLNWLHGLADNDLISKFQILHFPYYILLKPDGTIEAVDLSIDQIKTILNTSRDSR